MEQMQAQILEQQQSIGTLRGDMVDAVRRQNEDLNTFVEATKMKYAENRLHLEEIVIQAKAQFDKTRSSPQTASEFDLREQQTQANLEHIVTSAKAEFDDIKNKLEAQGTNIEQYVDTKYNNLVSNLDKAWANLTEKFDILQKNVNSGGPGSSGHTDSKTPKGYLPMKNMIPKTFTDKLEDWLAWQEAVEDFFDNTNPEMKGYLQAIKQETTEVPDFDLYASRDQDLEF
jgi:predicted transcriptional regulator YdeE